MNPQELFKAIYDEALKADCVEPIFTLENGTRIYARDIINLCDEYWMAETTANDYLFILQENGLK